MFFAGCFIFLYFFKTFSCCFYGCFSFSFLCVGFQKDKPSSGDFFFLHALKPLVLLRCHLSRLDAAFPSRSPKAIKRFAEKRGKPPRTAPKNHHSKFTKATNLPRKKTKNRKNNMETSIEAPKKNEKLVTWFKTSSLSCRFFFFFSGPNQRPPGFRSQGPPARDPLWRQSNDMALPDSCGAAADRSRAVCLFVCFRSLILK